MTVEELVERYLSTRIGVKPNTKANYNFVKNLMKKEDFYYKKIGDVKTSDAKLFLIKLQQDGKRYSTVKTVRGVLRPAFQMAVDDDVLHKNPFGFELAGVVVNDSVTREALTRDQMRKFLKFVLWGRASPALCHRRGCSHAVLYGAGPRDVQKSAHDSSDQHPNGFGKNHCAVPVFHLILSGFYCSSDSMRRHRIRRRKRAWL